MLVPQSSSFTNEHSDRASLNSDSQYVATPRSLVTNFISGIRQRKWNAQQVEAPNQEMLNKPSSFFNFNLNARNTKQVKIFIRF